MSEGDFPPMPDDLDSETPPVYCATIVDAKAQAAGTAVELQCKPINSTTSGSFVMGEDDTYDTLITYYSGTVVADDRVNKITGTIHVSGSDKVLDVRQRPRLRPQRLHRKCPDRCAWQHYLGEDSAGLRHSLVASDAYHH